MCELVVCEEQFNPIQSDSAFVQKDCLPRPIYGDMWLQYPFPSIMLPVNNLRIGDSVLVSLSFAGDCTIQGVIKAGPGASFGAGPSRMSILSYQVDLEIIWINSDHRSIRLPDDFTFLGVEFVRDLYRKTSWLFPWTSISHVLLQDVYVPVLSSASSYRHFQPLNSW
jgi:hypothetical protein